jgi:Tol biopolymer transport system component
MPSANTLVLYEDGQALIRLSRAGGPLTSPSQGTGRLGRAVQPSQPSQQTTTRQLISDYRPQQNYQANNAGGSIVYTRYEVFRVNTGQQLVNVPTPKLFIMNADGSNQRAFIYPPQFDHAETPNWSPDYRWLLFSSNYQMAKSAMYQDIFSMDRASGAIKRLTGNEWSAGPVKGYGTIVGTVHDDTISAMDQMMGETSTMLSVKNQVMISVQGGGGKIHYAKRTVADLKDQYPDWDPDAKYYNDPYKWLFIIPQVPAGKLWVKAWKSKHMGDMAIIDVEPNAVTEVELVLSKGNYLVSHPSISPDGRYLVGMSTHCYFYPASPTQGKYTVKNEAHGTVVVADLSSPSALPAVWNQMRAGGMAAKAPRLSPDGATLALSAGQLETLENLVLCPLLSVVQGYPKPRVLVPYRRVLASHQEANDSPSWSPDGRRLVFVRSAMGAGGNIIANLYTVNANGGTPRQLTQVGQNQAVAYPCWSPDGNSIAFQVVTSKNQTLNITDIAVMNMTSDIYTIQADGSNLQRLTSDGRSAEPAWGP